MGVGEEMPQQAGERHGTVEEPSESPVSLLGLETSTEATNCFRVAVPPMEYSVKGDVVKKFSLWVHSFEDSKRRQGASAVNKACISEEAPVAPGARMPRGP